MSLLVHLGYEREWVVASEPGDVAHAWLQDRSVALCGARLGTTFDLILFGTAMDALPNGRAKCKGCLITARAMGVE